METMRIRPRSVPPRTLADIGLHLDVTPVAGGDVSITGISLNTDFVRPGDLYAAMPGSRAHGIDYLDAALAGGAVAVLTDVEGAATCEGVPHVVVENPRRVLAELSAWFYEHPAESITMIGITGTQGKTTSTYLAQAALGASSSAVIGTIGTQIGSRPAPSSLTTPEAPALQAILAVIREEQLATCAMEVSSHALVQGRVDGFVFDVAVFLNLGRDHLDFHATIEDYFVAKASLFTPEHAKQAIINIDDEYGRRLNELTPLPVTTFSTQGRPADWQAVNVRPHRLGSDFTLLDAAGASHEVTVPLPGVFNVSNAVAVLAALTTAGLDLEPAIAGLGRSPGVPGRMERVAAGQQFSVIVDYAHKPDAVEAVLDALRPVTAGRLIVVLGAGGNRDQGKRPVMGRAAAERADLVIVTDDNPRDESPAQIRSDVMLGAQVGPAAAVEIAGRRDAIEFALTSARPGDTVVIAGKGHEVGQEIEGTVHHFDDREVAREILAGLTGADA